MHIFKSDEELKKEFSSLLRKALRKRALTQSQLADMADISRVQISHYIQGKMLPSFYNLYKIVEVLNCSPDEFHCFK